MKAMTIAGFDPSGGAGVLNDIKTFHALDVYGTAVITALTAQNVKRVEDIHPVETEFIQKQMDLVLEEENIKYAKTGMLYSPEIIETVAQKISQYEMSLVLDPVMVAGSGDPLSQKGIAETLKKHLLPLSELCTPNIFEAELLSGLKITDEKDVVEAALKIGEICNVVVTGGHLKGSDVLFNGSIKVFRGELLESQNTHGSGCTYSAAATAYMARGCDLEKSLKKAGEFVRNSIKSGSYGTLDQFWRFKKNNGV
jgi:hydroxymethylpyrimidine/phosphomethylpyrimidine kinase